MADFIIDINAPETSLMSVDIQASIKSPVIELSMSSGFEVDVTSAQSMSIDIVAGSIKGDKGDPGGLFLYKTASEDIGGHRVIILNDDNKVSYASSNVEDNYNRVVGITTHAVSAQELVEIQMMDIMEEPTWAWVSNKPLYLSTDGRLTQDVSMTYLFVLQVATALSPTRILIRQQISIFN